MQYALLIFLVFSSMVHAEGNQKPIPEGNIEVRIDSPVDVIVKSPVDVDIETPVNVDVSTPVDVHIENPVDINNPVEVNTPVTIRDEGTRVTTINRTSAQVPDSFVHYSPNYIQCMRTFGLQFANTSFSSFFGFPLNRDAACDLWIAAEEAQQNNHILLQYGFMCQVKNVRKVWGKERCGKLTTQALDWLDASLEPQDEEPASAQTQQMLIAAREVEELEEELNHTQIVVTTQAHEIEELKKQISDESQIRRRVQESVKQIDDAEQIRQRQLDAFLDRLEQRTEKK